MNGLHLDGNKIQKKHEYYFECGKEHSEYHISPEIESALFARLKNGDMYRDTNEDGKPIDGSLDISLEVRISKILFKKKQ